MLTGSVLSVWSNVEAVLTNDGQKKGQHGKMQVRRCDGSRVYLCVCVCMCVLVCGIKTSLKCPVQSCPHAAGGREEDSWHPDYQYLFQVVRMRLEEGRRIVGPLIPSSAMDTLVRTLKVTNAKVEFLNAYG